MRRYVGIVASMALVAGVSAGMPPPLPLLGVVYCRDTGAELVGVNVVAYVDELRTAHPELSQAAHQVHAITDSLGEYQLHFFSTAEVVYYRAGYDSLRLRWPADLRTEEECECGGCLRDVFLRPVQ